jgi:hypothetical protein
MNILINSVIAPAKVQKIFENRHISIILFHSLTIISAENSLLFDFFRNFAKSK